MTGWQAAVGASNAFTPEQAQRVHAVRCAREVVQTWTGAGALGASRGSSVDLDALLSVADWIMTGIRPVTPVTAPDVPFPTAIYGTEPSARR